MIHGGNVWEGGSPERWLDFSANLRPEGPPEWVEETMRRALRDTRYYPDRAMRFARQGLADWAGVPWEHILPTPGGVAAIDGILSRHKGPVAITSPTFGEYAARAAAHGREIQKDWKHIKKGTTVALCNPNNPTGEALEREEVLARHEIIFRQGGEMMVDEAFIDFCPECSVRRDVSDTLSVAGSLTKLLGVPGIRLGYICASSDFIAWLEKLALPWALGTLAAAVAAELPRHKEEIQLDAEKNSARRQAFADALTQLGVSVKHSRANFLLCDFHQDMREPSARLKEQGILVRDCSSFGLSESWLRLAVKTEAQNDRLLRALSPLLQK